MKKLFVLLFTPIILFSQEMWSNLPIVIINTNNQTILDNPRIICDMGIIHNIGENSSNDVYNDYNGKVSIEIRGSSSQNFPKKSYGFETQNTDGSNNNVSLLNLPEENDWILHAPYSDKTLLRNVLTYWLSEKMGHYAPRTQYCELILNDEYQGVYVLMEKIKRDRNRVNIKEMDEEDVTGGYIIKIDKLTDASEADRWCSNFTTFSGSTLCFQYHYPKTNDLNSEQKFYIEHFMNNTIQELTSISNEDDLDNLESVNILSFVDYFIISELGKNIDSYRLSTFLYKDSDENLGKLTMGPVWDYNLAYGNADYCDGFNTEGWLFDTNCSDGMPKFWDYLFQNKNFREKLIERWFSLRETVLSTASILNYIDNVALKLDEAKDRNFEKWDILGIWVWPNFQLGLSYQGEIEFLKYWVFNRLNWMDYSISDFQSTMDVCADENKELIQITDQLGRSVSNKDSQIRFYIYENGCVEKKFISYKY